MQNINKFKILFCALLICLGLGLFREGRAAEIILNNLDGQPVSVSSYQGKPVILFFWTTWCPYCRQEIKILNQHYSKIVKADIVLMGVNVSESDYKVQRFFKGYSLNFPMLLDKAGKLADQYDLIGVPTYVCLDKTGKLISRSNNFPERYKYLLDK